MMYKAFLFAMVLFLIPVCNAKAETREDLLLIYQDNLSKEQTENVKLFSETLTALGKKLDFQNETDAQEVLDDYPYVICYDIKDADEKFLKNLEEYQGRLFIFGSDLMTAYLKQTGQEQKILEKKSQKRGVLNDAFEKIVKVDDLYSFQGEEYENGTLRFSDFSIPFCLQIAYVRFIPVTRFDNQDVPASLTFMVNNVPVTTYQMDYRNGKEQILYVEIPVDMLKEGYNSFDITGYVRIYDEEGCIDDLFGQTGSVSAKTLIFSAVTA